MKRFFDRILTTTAADPDDARRRRLINILLLGFFFSAIFGLMVLGIDKITSKSIDNTDAQWLLGIIGSFLLVTVLIYIINRYSGKSAAFFLLFFMVVIFSFSDTSEELANGRSLFLFTIPIAISSLILFPSASFIFAALGSGIISLLAISISLIPNLPVIAGFFIFALVSWLSSRSLEQALKELREININLDSIVKERTHELALALTRERIEAGRSQAILESIADGVIVFNPQGSAIQANPALSSLINIPLNNLVNSTVDDLIEASTMDAINKGTLARILTKPGIEQLASHRVGWGQKTISVSSSQVLDRDGSKVGTVAVFRDFTKEAELERMKSAFVAIVSHELRTPLSAILGYAEIFKERVYGPLNEKQMKTTNRIISNSRRLLYLINDLLDQAQMEAGKLKMKYEKIKPASLLENLHSVMDKLTTDKGTTLTSKLDEDMPKTIVGDPARLQQILVNLVNNAVKFTEEGSIQVKLSKVDEKQWGITVTDTGRGIPEDELPYIFETFRQVEGTTTRVHGGFGLGLSIVKQLVDLMGGSISVESEVGIGSKFFVKLPLEITEKKKEDS